MFRLNKQLQKDHGFTLVEIAMVLLISGMTMLIAANFIKQYTVNTQYEQTLEHVSISQKALEEYAGLRGVYPCPADPTLAPGDANYGRSVCRNYTAGTFDPDACVNVPLNIACTVAFSRDGDLNGSPDPVMIGVLPFRTLAETVVATPFSESDRLDGYRSLLTYAVSEPMTNTAQHSLTNPVNPATGAIRVEDENRISVTTPDDSAHFVVFSHGENKKGGYSSVGVMSDNCMVSTVAPPAPPAIPIPGPSAAGIQLEIENCDRNDAIFVKGIQSLGDNDNFFDDVLFYTATGLKPLWKRSLTSPTGQSYIYNTNLGNVGVGTDLPTHRLHVLGSISAETRLVSVDSEFCNENETACLDPEAIGGTGTKCPANQVAYAVGDNEVKCRSIDWATPNKSCTPIGGLQGFVQAVSNLGNLYCCNASGTCEFQ
tara:strand:- start:1057 stop:2340 length:1284 start_codon:yes stop_codon:yes gene_type:complete